MSGGVSADDRKQAYFGKLIKLLEEYPKILIVGADNVGSSHMQKIRISLRGQAVLLMGKNTMIRKAIRGHAQNNAALEAILPHVRGNVGFVFTKGDLNDIKKVVAENVVSAPARAGSFAPCDVTVPGGNTGLEPTQTSFFQALNIQTKITRGQIEITQDVPLIKTGEKVGASEANLLAKLNIKPFSYGLKVQMVYDEGAVYEPHILDLTDAEIIKKFSAGVANIAAIGLAIGYPTIASVPHSIVRGFKNVISVALAIDYETDALTKLKAAAASAPVASASAAAPASAPAKGGPAPPKAKEPEPEPDDGDGDMGFGLFD